jgi:hypothetical protein
MVTKYKYNFSITSNTSYQDTSYSILMRCFEVDEQGNVVKDVETASYNYLTIDQCMAYQITFQNR